MSRGVIYLCSFKLKNMKKIELTEEEISVLTGILESELYEGNPNRMPQISAMIKPHIESILTKIEE